MIMKAKFIKRCVEFLVCAMATGILIAGCGGGSSTSASVSSFTASVGAGDVLQFSVDTASLTYSFKVVETSYGAAAVASGIPAASAVEPTESSSGTLTANAEGSYNISQSADGFILGGEVLPIQNSMFVGHVIIDKIGGRSRRIPIFGVSNPITTIAGLASTYNYQGFECAGRSGGNPHGNIACASHTGTILIDSTGVFSTCKDGNLTGSTTCILSGGSTTSPTSTGSLVATATSGVYDFKTSDGLHRGWLFAFTAGGQNVAVIDHDDIHTPSFGHSVAISQAKLTTGQIDGNYFVMNNMGERHSMAISGVSFTDTGDNGHGTPASAVASGALQYNSPWNGLVTYQFNNGGASGVMDVATIGAFTYNSTTHPYIFGVGLKH